MRIKNRTHYITRDLKRIMTECARRASRSGEEKRTRRLIVEIGYAKRYGYSGYAYYSGTYMMLRIPRDINNFNSKMFARLFYHEYDHILGYRHNEIGGRYITSGDYNDEGFDNPEWAVNIREGI